MASIKALLKALFGRFVSKGEFNTTVPNALTLPNSRRINLTWTSGEFFSYTPTVSGYASCAITGVDGLYLHCIKDGVEPQTFSVANKYAAAAGAVYIPKGFTFQINVSGTRGATYIAFTPLNEDL